MSFRSELMCVDSSLVDFSSAEQLSLLLRHPDQPENPRLIRVAVLGAPNAGKSTLTNQLLGRKVACCQLYAIENDLFTFKILKNSGFFAFTF